MTDHTPFEELTRKQQLIIDAHISAEEELQRSPTLDEVAERAYDDCDNSYVHYTLGKYGDTLRARGRDNAVPVTDGEGSYAFELGSTDTWKAIRMLPEELSQKIYDQVRQQD